MATRLLRKILGGGLPSRNDELSGSWLPFSRKFSLTDEQVYAAKANTLREHFL